MMMPSREFSVGLMKIEGFGTRSEASGRVCSVRKEIAGGIKDHRVRRTFSTELLGPVISHGSVGCGSRYCRKNCAAPSSTYQNPNKSKTPDTFQS